MGFIVACSQTLNYMICAFIFLLLLLLHTPSSSSALISSSSSPSSTTSSPSPSPSSSSSSHEIQPQTPSDVPTTAATQYQVFYIKNTTLFPLDKQELSKKHRKVRHKMNKRVLKKRKKSKNFRTRPFSVMLPKGFVPPSGSSPCHNGYPNSVVFFCDLAPTTSKP